ncbi:MAG: SET domain-containing protein-lysine N-methyltransferase [Chitinophagaceae bacterium]|nr:SET domain-containing protein-lysine N-methyltransferase [Chitinophagaceae bacterium]
MSIADNTSWCHGLKICVLQPDYSTTGVDYKNYDPPRDISALLPGAQTDHVLLNKLTTYRQLRDLKEKGYDIYVNLCEGYLEWEVPSIDVIHCLDILQLPYTGPTALLYDPEKPLMKYVAYTEGITTPAHTVIQREDDLLEAMQMAFPLFVKPAKAGDSLGIDQDAVVYTAEALRAKIQALLPLYKTLLVEQYIAGREFTVLVAGAADGRGVKTYQPIEYLFPEGFAFKTYALKTSELHPDANVPVTDAALDAALRDAATRIFRGFQGQGYARLDFRMDEKGTLYFLEINFTCSVFYPEGYEGSADHILRFDPAGQAGFLEQIIREGISRHLRMQQKYYVKGNAIAGYGIYAKKSIMHKEVIFMGEQRSQRLVTRRQVMENWTDVEKEIFRKYAYPLSDEVFLLWDSDPAAWAPQNHSCQPNTAYDGLNVIALRPIQPDEELTLDYAAFLDEHMEPFPCQCGAPQCRQWITGLPGNSVTKRENLLRR